MGRGFGGGSFRGGHSSGGGRGGSSYHGGRHGRSSGPFSLIGFFLYLFLGGIILLPTVFETMGPQNLIPPSTHWRTPLPKTNDTTALMEINEEGILRNREALEKLYNQTGIIGKFINITLVYDKESLENIPNIYPEGLYYDGEKTFYFTPLYYSFSYEDLENYCQIIYDYLFQDENHMLIIQMNDFSNIDYLYYTGEQANTVFDAQAGRIFDAVIKKKYSFYTPSNSYYSSLYQPAFPETLLANSLIETTDRIMKPPILLYSIIAAIILLIILCIFIHWKKKKRKKLKAQSEANSSNGETFYLQNS